MKLCMSMRVSLQKVGLLLVWRLTLPPWPPGWMPSCLTTGCGPLRNIVVTMVAPKFLGKLIKTCKICLDDYQKAKEWPKPIFFFSTSGVTGSPWRWGLFYSLFSPSSGSSINYVELTVTFSSKVLKEKSNTWGFLVLKTFVLTWCLNLAAHIACQVTICLKS